ncbi:MAG: osmoprotectant transport system permease protein [Actinomycetota bacterium]|jgi:osmoprotectant transport system permease protein
MIATDKDSFIWWDWVGRHTAQIQSATYEHLRLTLLAVAIGFAVSLVLSAVCLRFRWTFTPIAGFAGLLYTIPSLALFAFLLPITGFNTLTAEIGLVSYTLAIFVRNIVAGVESVSPAVIDAADGMGLTRLRRLATVDVPLAAPAIVAALRIATVTTVGLVTVTGLIGQGGYGSFIESGLSRNFSTEIVVGGGLSIVMAVALDAVLVGVERIATPWTRARPRRGT